MNRVPGLVEEAFTGLTVRWDDMDQLMQRRADERKGPVLSGVAPCWLG